MAVPVTSDAAAIRMERVADQFVSLVRLTVHSPSVSGTRISDRLRTKEVIDDLVNARNPESESP